MSIRRDENIGLDIAEYLAGTWGFEPDPLWTPGRFMLVLDAQHAVTVEFMPWDEEPPGGAASCTMHFGVARRDINELRHQLFKDILGPGEFNPWTPTVEETNQTRFFGQDSPRWTAESDRDQMEQWCDVWVERLIAESPSLQWISAYLHRPMQFDKGSERQRALNAQSHEQRMRWPRIINRALNGWQAADTAELLDPIRPTPPTRRRELEAIETWIAANPNGLGRELAE